MKKGWITVKTAILVSVILAALLFPGVAAAVCVQPSAGMVSWWGGDNNALDMVGDNNATLMGGATYALGIVGQAFSFDGTANSYVEIAHNTSLDSTAAFTVDGWFYIDPNAPGNIGGEASLVAKGDGGVGGGGWFLWFQDSAAYTKALRFDILTWGSPAWPYAEVNNIIMSAGWYHIAGVFDLASDPQAKLYMNGALVASSSSTISAILNNSYPLRIGASNWGVGDRFNGKADEVEFYSRALDVSEIAAIYNAGTTGKCRSCTPPSDMVSWWTGDNIAIDIVGGYNGTLQGGATFAPGMVRQAFSFDGNGYVVVADNANLQLPDSEFAISLWFKTPINNASQMLLSKGVSDLAEEYSISLQEDGAIYWDYGGGQAFVLTQPGIYNADQWYHLVVIYNSVPPGKVYLNGVEQTLANSGTGGHIVSSGSPLYIGSQNGGDPYYPGRQSFTGLIDEVEIFNHALSAAEIQALYNSGSAGQCRSCVTPPDNMVSWWKGENSPNDATGANNGTLMKEASFAPGIVGQALSFDGEDDHILVPHSASLDITGAITMDAWFKLDELADSAIIIKGDSNGTIPLSSYSLGVFSDGKVYIGLYYGDTYDPYISTDSLVSADQWYHVAATWDGTTTNSDNVKLYLNGSLIQKWDKTTSLNSTTEPVTIGSMQGPTYYHSLKGLIDEVEIFNRALTAGEIAAIAKATDRGKCATFYDVTFTAPGGHGSLTCTVSVLQGYPSVCTITPDTGYYLSALLDNAVPVDIAGSVVGGTYTIPSVSEPHTLAATFSEYMIKRVSSSDHYYNLLTEVIPEVTGGDTVMLRPGPFTGCAYDRPGVSINLKGGYPSGFGSNAGQYSTISDQLTISSGTVTVENVTIQ